MCLGNEISKLVLIILIHYLFKVGSKEIKAHRCVLGQHSPVFRSMFNNESMIEAREGVIDIQDAKYESVR